MRINKIFCFEGSDGVPVHSGRPGKGDPEVRRRAAVSLPAQTGSLYFFHKKKINPAVSDLNRGGTPGS